MEQLIETLTTQLEALDREIEAALAFDPTWAASAQRLQTIPGIGPLVAAWLLVTTLNFTLCESAFYERLRAAGKPMKVARCAAARKLLQLAYAVVSRQQDFDPDSQSQQPHPPATAG